MNTPLDFVVGKEDDKVVRAILLVGPCLAGALFWEMCMQDVARLGRIRRVRDSSDMVQACGRTLESMSRLAGLIMLIVYIAFTNNAWNERCRIWPRLIVGFGAAVSAFESQGIDQAEPSPSA
jgi:hypothetical protein